MKKRRLQQLFKFTPIQKWSTAIISVGFLLKKNTKLASSLLSILLVVGFTTSLIAQTAMPPTVDIPTPKQSLRFEANVGQFNEQVLYRANDAQATHFFLNREIRTTIKGSEKDEGYAYGMSFVDASENASFRAIGGGRGQMGQKSYINERGSFPDVPLHLRLEYNDLWDGVKAVFFESDGQMKYDFKVAPGADPSQVKLLMKGAEDLRITEDGELEFTTSLGKLRKGAPFTYQMIDRKRVEIPTKYKINGDTISFEIAEYNTAIPLTIDPIALKWSAYLDGENWSPSDSYYDPISDRLYITGETHPDGSNISGTLPDIGTTSSTGPEDIVVMAMEADGSALIWSLLIGGSSQDKGHGIYADAAGDIFVRGATKSADFPVNGTVPAFDATYNGDWDQFIFRLGSEGTVLKYSTYFGGTRNNWGNTLAHNIVVAGDAVYSSCAIRPADIPDLPTPTYQSPSGPNVGAGVFKINTAVGGAASLEGFALFGENLFGGDDIQTDAAGNIYISGWDYSPDDQNLTSDAVQTLASLEVDVPNLEANGGGLAVVAKFNADLTNLAYASFVLPAFAAEHFYSELGSQRMDVDEEGNIYCLNDYASYPGTGPISTLLYAPTTGSVRDYSHNLYAGNWNVFRTLTKIPVSNPSTYSFINLLPGDDTYRPKMDVEVDNKGRIHLVNTQYAYDEGTGGRPSQVTTTPGAVLSAADMFVINPSAAFVMTYSVFGSNGGRAYSTVLPHIQGFQGTGSMTLDKENCTAYVVQGLTQGVGLNSGSPTPILTPSYRDKDTDTQVNVINTSHRSDGTYGFVAVFHEPKPDENTINDFLPGNDVFCEDALIYQDPNEGPLIGNDLTYISGDGSSSTHNLPLLFQGGVASDHPTPTSPAYQWQVSQDAGVNWNDIAGGTLAVLKPEPETNAGTVQYRRAVISGCCDTLYSNVATATIAGVLNLDINAPIDPVYYCPGTLKNLGITISGASGNISWQWYNGFTPLTTEITPASATNVGAGTFSADISTTATEGGSYRLIVTDGSGCKKEAFVTIAPLTAPASLGDSVKVCPSITPSVTIGPSAVNPDFDYSWAGPGGFTSTLANPTVTATGPYTLEVKLKTDVSFCTGGATTVTINDPIAHDAALVAIGDSEFCQSDSPAPIGLTGTSPTGYVYQWAPGINLDDAQAYSPNFDPGSLPFDVTPISEVEYTFTALRLSDGCIFETTTMVSDTARALAQAGIDLPSCGNTQTFGAPETTGNYWEWRAVATTYPGDVAALTAHANFSMDGSTTNLGTNKFLTGGFPSHTACYTIDYEIIASYTPFPANCITRDTVRLFYCPTCGGDWCSDLSSNTMGTDGACSGTSTIIGGSSLGGLSYTWTTYSVDGVVQPANTAPQGLFEMNADTTKGTALVGGAAHASQAIADFDDATWGWSGANVVIYRLTANGNFGAGEIDCHRDIQVFSANDATPVIAVLDQSFCTIELPGVRLGSAGKNAPYTISGVDYTQAPNSAFNWEWSVISGTTGSITADGTTPFPTLEPMGPSSYQIIVRDPVTGCIAVDTLMANIVSVVANAGDDISAVCSGALVQLGTTELANHTYSWSPTGGLSSPPNMANSMVAEPYLLVGSDATYTVTVTETTSGCQATDAMDVTTTTDAPPTPSAETYSGCPDAVFKIGPDNYTTPYLTYSWTAQGGTADIAWLAATDVLNPEVTLPNSFTGPATFRLTVSQGSCPTAFQDYIINGNPPAPNLGADVTFDCSSATTQINHGFSSGYEYAWSPIDNLYTNSTGTSAYNGSYRSSYFRIYAAPTESTTYTFYMRDLTTGCQGTDDINVTVPTAASADAGSTLNYCPGSGSVAIAASGTGGSYAWTATGYSSTSGGNPIAPTAGEEATMLTYLSSTTGLSINFEQTTPAPGKYVYTLTATNGSCAATDELEVIVPETGTENLAGISTSVCEGESVQLGVSNPPAQFTYLWRAINPSSQSASIDDTSSPNPTVNPTVSTTYELTYTDQITGCTGSESITVSVTPKPSIADVAMATQCAPISAVDLTAQIPSYGTYFNQVWTEKSVPGAVVATPTSVMPSKTTAYYLVAENEFGCADTAVVTVNVGSPQTPNIITNVATSCPATSIDLADYQGTPSDPAFTLEWHSDNTTNPATLLSNTVVSSSGTYYLFETTPDGCSSGSDSSVYVAEVCCPAQNCGTVTITINNN